MESTMQNRHNPPAPFRIRKIKKSFAWIDHRFWRKGYFTALNNNELRLYIFCVLVADQFGLSFWGDKRICKMFGWEQNTLSITRKNLSQKELRAHTKITSHLCRALIKFSSVAHRLNSCAMRTLRALLNVIITPSKM